MAKNLAEADHADLYEIKPAVPYTKADLDWMDKKCRSSVEMNDKTSRPALADKDDTMHPGMSLGAFILKSIVCCSKFVDTCQLFCSESRQYISMDIN